MAKELVISAAPHETRVAILEEGQLCEIYIEREKEFALVGSIYKGRVTRVLPGMQSAFVDIGLDGDAFLYVSDVFENLEDYDHVAAPVEQKTEKMEEQGGQAFPPVMAGEAADASEAAGPSESETGAESTVRAEALPGESFGPRGGVGSGSGEQAPSEQSSPRYTGAPQGQRGPRSDRGPREGQGFRPGGDRGGRGRGSSDRWGRRGGRNRGRGGRPGPQGRDLPPSKYASPHAGSQPGSEGRGFERHDRPERSDHTERPERFDRPAQAEPFVLPGESLAKYRERTPVAAITPPIEPPAAELETEIGGEAAPRAGDASNARKSSYSGLPSWVLADATAALPSDESAVSSDAGARAGSGPATPSAGADEMAESGRMEEPVRETHLAADADLSDEEVSLLAAQVAQAKHEETQDEAEADGVSGGAEFDEEGQGAEAGGTHEAEARSDEAVEGEEDAEAEGQQETELEVAEAMGAAGAAPADAQESDVILLPGETRHPSESAPSFEPRSARIEERPRARFERPRPAGRGPGGPQRGGRRFGGGRHGRDQNRQDRRPNAPQRRPQLISEMLKAGQEVIVQIAKEPLGKKGARITSHVALPGRYLVYMPTVNHIGVSRKIESAENRARLRGLVSEAGGSYPGGFIVRTAAGGASDEDIRTDIEFLGRTWSDIKTKSEDRKAPSLMHRDLNLVERILRDYVNEDYTAIWIDNEEEYGKVLEFVGRFQPKLVNRVKLFTKETPIFEELGIQHELDKALRPKVWLKSGGYIVINHTEALVAIDVNTGKFVGKGSTRLEDTIVKTNVEAVKEIVRQIRLRDLGGIIVVDFIDMEERRNREKVMSALQQALESDKAPSKVLSFNEFGLVAITRKRTKQALERVLCQPCPYCSGSGMVKSIATICYEIQNEARKMAVDHDAPNLTLRVHPEIAKSLKTREAALVDELEQSTRKHVIIQSDATLHFEQYDIY